MKEEHFDLLGFEAKDKVTGYSGVITTLSFDLYGCVQVVITPKIDKDGKIPDGRWFDVSRLQLTGTEPVMERPDFVAGYVATGKKGASDKPIPS